MSATKDQLEALKTDLQQSIRHHRDTAEIHLNHAKDYSYKALVKHASSNGDTARKIENMAIEHAFTHEGLSRGHEGSVYALEGVFKKVCAILDQIETKEIPA